jgi:MFS family permease
MITIETLQGARARLRRTIFGHAAESLDDRNYRNLLISGAWFGPAEGGIFNFLPVFVARLGASPTMVSLLTAGPSLVGIFSYLPGGAYAERRPDQVRLVVRAGFLARLSYLLIALLPFFLPPEQVVIAIVLIWSLTAIPNAVHVPAWTAMMQRAVPPGRRAKLNGARWGLMSLIASIAMAVYGVMLNRMDFPLGYQIVFMISFLAAMMNLVYFSRVVIPPFVSGRGDGAAHGSIFAEVPGLFRAYFSNRRFVRFLAASGVFRLALAMPVGLFSIYWVNDLEATDALIGLRGTAGYIALVVGYFFWGRTANRIGHRRMLMICGLGQACYPVLTALASDAYWLLPAAAVWGLTAAGIDLGLFDMLLAACPEGRQPTFAAGSAVFASVAVTIGPLLGAAMAQNWSTQAALVAIGGVQAASTLAFLLLPGRDQEDHAL